MALIFGGDVTKTWDSTATAQSGDQAPHELGAVARVPRGDGNGDKWFVFVQNSSGADIPVGTLCQWIAGTDSFRVEISAAAAGPSIAPAMLAGVAQVVIADGFQGWVQTWGRCASLQNDGSGAWTAGNALASSGTVDGAVDVTAVTDAATVAIARSTPLAGAIGAADLTISTGK